MRIYNLAVMERVDKMIIDPDDLAVVMEKDPAIVDENDAIKYHTGLQAVSMYRESNQLWLAGEKEKGGRLTSSPIS